MPKPTPEQWIALAQDPLPLVYGRYVEGGKDPITANTTEAMGTLLSIARAGEIRFLMAARHLAATALKETSPGAVEAVELAGAGVFALIGIALAVRNRS